MGGGTQREGRGGEIFKVERNERDETEIDGREQLRRRYELRRADEEN